MESSKSENFPSEQNSNSRVTLETPLLRLKSDRSQAEWSSAIADINRILFEIHSFSLIVQGNGEWGTVDR